MEHEVILFVVIWLQKPPTVDKHKEEQRGGAGTREKGREQSIIMIMYHRLSRHMVTNVNNDQ